MLNLIKANAWFISMTVVAVVSNVWLSGMFNTFA